ncbi:MAG: site-2 protease family protein [Candidatus Margulisiibacteriota bacterium]
MILFSLRFAILMLSIIIHEVAHGVVANRFGDPTAKALGRITLNPIPHIDVLGSIVVPLICLVSGTPFFMGWAKPVPVNMRYFHNPYRDMMWVALAGPLSNFTQAAVFGLFWKWGIVQSSPILQECVATGVVVNIWLGLFNLFPIPPLDGSRIVAYFLPWAWRRQYEKLEPYGMVLVFLLAYLGIFSTLAGTVMSPILRWIF